MSPSIEITMIANGFAVTSARGRTVFRSMDEAVAFARAHLERAFALRELSARCE